MRPKTVRFPDLEQMCLMMKRQAPTSDTILVSVVGSIILWIQRSNPYHGGNPNKNSTWRKT